MPSPQLPSPSDHPVEPAAIRRLIVLGGVSLGLYAAVALLSRRFAITIPSAERPHLAMSALFAALFTVYLLALRAVEWQGQQRSGWPCAQERRMLTIIFAFALVFRLLLLGTTPIQEIDLYRYLWDGNVTASGVSPYRFSPQEVRDAVARSGRVGQSGKVVEGGRVSSAAGGPASAPSGATLRSSLGHPSQELEQLAVLTQQSPALDEILHTVHFAELTTPYPPVSQAVFALASLTTPDTASTHMYLVVMKAWIVLFDLLTIVAVIGLLREARLPQIWCLAYAWCPLVIKEFANSGHLDAIAVCLTTTALWLLIGIKRQQSQLLVAAGALGLGVGAKLFPIILLPLTIAWLLGRRRWLQGDASDSCTTLRVVPVDRDVTTADANLRRSGTTRRVVQQSGKPEGWPTSSWRSAVLFGVGVLLVAGITLSPMATVERNSASGLSGFLTRWQMNDLLFRVADENLDPSRPQMKQPWFAVLPDEVRMAIIAPVMEQLHVDARTAAFLLTRCLTLGLFGLIAGWLLWRTAVVPLQRDPTPTAAQQKSRHLADAGPRPFLEAAFLTLAWFWLLAPTQNPWYWTWCLPLLPFARSRVWLWVSGMAMVYYLRFWFNAHWPDSPGPLEGLGGAWNGASFFDFVVVWLEFGPVFVGLLVGWLIRRRQQ